MAQRLELLVGVIAVALLALESWVLFQVLSQQGRLLLRIEAIEMALPAKGTAPQPAPTGTAALAVTGVPVGTPASSFALPNLTGETITLDALRTLGKKADHFSQNDSLAFPLSLEAAARPQVEGPSRFARALKRARMARGWTPAKLAAQLAISKRSMVSWETGERIPSVGMVLLLLDALFPGEELSFQRELLTAYLVDDLQRQQQRRASQRGQGDPWLQRA